MTAAATIREVRRRSGLSLRELARRAGTSHATIHAYETGAKEPRLDTVSRLADAAGFALEVGLAPRADAADGRLAKGAELAEALLLAAAFPARRRGTLATPVFARRPG